ncbi:MAG: methyltransferase domain-containing protein [Actinobacteria bacterium]|nr:methyltransferase domain-containing protein [Actinomycetota bacterium]
MSDFEPEKIATSYDVVAQDYAAKFFDELDDKPGDRALLDDIATRTNGIICDLGCGPGHVARYLATRGADVLGVDLSQEMVAVARRRNPGLRFEQSNMLDLGWVDAEAWGGVVAFYSLIHIVRRRVPDALAEIRRVLRRGGLLAVGAHAGEGEIRADGFLGHHVPFAGTYFELDELRSFIDDAGFEVERAIERPPYEREGGPRLYVVAKRGA